MNDLLVLYTVFWLDDFRVRVRKYESFM